MQRVRDVQTDFTATAENEPAIAEICARLDWLPLAIELAAWRIRIYGTAQALLTALEPALPELIEGPRDVPARQRTMRATIAWSYELLDADVQWLFRQLSVCRGGCTMQTVLALGKEREDVTTWLESLIGQGLLQRTPEADGQARVWMFDVMAEFGLEQLAAEGELTEAKRRHAAHFLMLAEMAAPLLQGPEQMHWVRRLEREHDNLRSALEWAVRAGEEAIALQLTAALWRFWEVGGYISEGRGWLSQAIDLGGDAPPEVRARALYAAARLATLQADYVPAETLHQHSYDVFREVGDRRGMADVMNSWGGLAHGQADYERAISLHMESLKFYTLLGERLGMADAQYNLGLVHALQGNAPAAGLHYETASGLLKEIGDTRGYALAQLGVSMTRYLAQDWEGALGAFRECLALAEEAHDMGNLAYALDGIAAVSGVQAEYERAARLFGAADRLRSDLGLILPPSYHDLVASAVGVAQMGMPSKDAFTSAYKEGQALPLKQVLALAWGDFS